jgi:hypothetical protein
MTWGVERATFGGLEAGMRLDSIYQPGPRRHSRSPPAVKASMAAAFSATRPRGSYCNEMLQQLGLCPKLGKTSW